jgi:hypothetical protein
MSTTLAVPVANLPPVSLIQVANLPLVSLIPVLYLDLQNISGNVRKIRKDPEDIFKGLGEDDS